MDIRALQRKSALTGMPLTVLISRLENTSDEGVKEKKTSKVHADRSRLRKERKAERVRKKQGKRK